MSDLARKVYYGKFRGTVSDNQDPLGLGRIKVRVPQVKGDQESSWALPAAPYAGDGVGWFMIPPKEAWVWVEFENGNWDLPIWSGCFWDQGQVPASPAVPEMKVLKTDTATITINDQSGQSGVTIETNSGLKIVMNSDGIELSNGSQKIQITSGKVAVNGDALEII